MLNYFGENITNRNDIIFWTLLELNIFLDLSFYLLNKEINLFYFVLFNIYIFYT